MAPDPDGGYELHGTRKVRTDGKSVVVTIPPEAVEKSGIEPGEQVMVGSEDDGAVVLIPWSESDIGDELGQ